MEISVSETVKGLAIALTASVPFVYFLQMLKGKVKPNLATFGVFLIVSLLNAVTYMVAASFDGWQTAMGFAPIFGLVAIVFTALKKNHRTKWGYIETRTIIGTITLVIAWLFWQAGPVNVLTQIVIASAIVPTVLSIKRGDIRDNPLSWSLAFTGYMLMTCILVFVEGKTSMYDLSFPAMRVLMNGTVLGALFQSYRTKRASS